MGACLHDRVFFRKNGKNKILARKGGGEFGASVHVLAQWEIHFLQKFFLKCQGGGGGAQNIQGGANAPPPLKKTLHEVTHIIAMTGHTIAKPFSI